MMKNRIRTRPWYAAPSFLGTGLLVGLVLALLGVTVALAAGNIDATNKWAWSTNAGWINFAPANGGVTVYGDHLEGYAWGENIGWIRLGTCSGSPCTHANTTAANYGVNNDGVGNLSGYAWGTNVGWINFHPADSQVTVDPVTGDFDGYAWAENVGWIHFKYTTPYKVNTTWRGDLTGTYQNNVAAIIKGRATGPASSGGLTIANGTFLNDSGDGIIFGHNNAAFHGGVTTNLPGGVAKRWARIWQLDVNDGAGTTGGQVQLTFDISAAGGQGNFSVTGTYHLLKRATGSSDDFTKVTVAGTSVSGDRLRFIVDVSNLGSEFTLGATADSPTAITLREFTAHSPGGINGLALPLVLAALGAVGGILLLRARWQERRKPHVAET